jgi:hypothetical protein
LAAPLELEKLRSMFDLPDYGVDEWTYDQYHPSDFLKLLFQYLHSLPDPLFSHEASVRFRNIWQYLPSTDRKAREMRSLLHDEFVPAIESTLIFFLLNFFAIVTSLPESPKVIARELHSCFFVVGTGVNNDGPWGNSDVLAFMIANSREILMPASAADMQLGYDWPLNHRSLTTVAPQQPSTHTAPETFAEQAPPERSESPSSKYLGRSSTVDRRDPLWELLRKELQAMGFTDDEFEENANYVNLYVKERKAEEKLKEKHSQSGKPRSDDNPDFDEFTTPFEGQPQESQPTASNQDWDAIFSNLDSLEAVGGQSQLPQPAALSYDSDVIFSGRGDSYANTGSISQQASTAQVAYTSSRRFAVVRQLREWGYTDSDFEVYSHHLDNYIRQDGKTYSNYRTTQMLMSAQSVVVDLMMFLELQSGLVSSMYQRERRYGTISK